MEVESISTANASNLPVPVRVILPTSYQFAINSEDLHRLAEMRRMFYEKESERKLIKSNFDESISANKPPIRRRDMEWLSIVLPFVKKYNPHCGICASSKNYGRRLDTANSYLLRSYFYCQGQDCPFNCSVTIKETGQGLLCSRFSNGNLVDHRNAKRVGRPNRSLNKSNQRLKCPANSVIQQWNQTLTEDLNLFDREDSNQSTKSFLQSCSNLLQLMENLRQDIEPSGPIQGAIQQISLNPFYVTIHTEKSVRYYHSILTNNHRPRVAYAIVEPIEFEEKKLVYCEFMLSNIGDTSMIPITVVCTDKFDDFQQENYVLKSWLERFRFDYEYLYKSQSKTYSFSQPSIILIDDHRETPLNNSLLQFFNHETFKEYIIRTYSYEQNNCQYILHVSSSLILVEFRTLVNKYVSTELRQLALWSSLLLIYTSTWPDIRQNWSLICEIFLNWGTNYVSLSSYEQLCAKVAEIENESDLKHLVDLIYNNHSNTNESYEPSIDDEGDDVDDELTEDIIDLSDFQNDHFYTKNMITNENNRYVSPYETDLREIFNEKNQSKTMLISSWETLSNSDRTILKKIKGNWKWLHLLLKDYISTIPLWSNCVSNQFKHKDLAKFLANKTQRLNQIKHIHTNERFDLVIQNSAKDLQIQVTNADMK